MKWEEPEQSSEERTEVLVQQVGQERVASASAGCGAWAWAWATATPGASFTR